MKDDSNWQDFKLFLSIVRNSGLIGATFETGLSSPTLGRRMQALEEQLGHKVFIRDNKGYSLTKYGQELFKKVLKIEQAALDIKDWQKGFSGKHKILISAGSLTFLHLTNYIGELWKPHYDWSLEFVAAEHRLNIAHGEVDIGIRAGQPSEPWLAGKKVGSVELAIYRHKDSMQDIPWIAQRHGETRTAWGKWIHQYHGRDIAFSVNEPLVLLSLLKERVGKSILPCFIGDNEPNLKREGMVIDDLTHDRWLVFHQDRRHHPALRSVINKLSKLFLKTRV